MLESDLRVLFERQAASEPPPAPISIPAARRIGRARLHRRRVGTFGAPVLAAGAVLAVALGGVISSGPTHPSAAPRPSGAPHPTGTPPATLAGPAPREFNPLVPYAAFGWLPFRNPVVIGGTGLTYVFLEASDESFQNTFNWTANAAGGCRLARESLTCQGQSGSDRLTGRAPDIDGHVAYWGYVPLPPPGPVNRILAYQYARNGWATIEFVGNSYRSDVLRIAASVRLGQKAHLRFAVQLTGLPAVWHLFPDQGFNVTPAGPLDSMFSLTSQRRAESTAIAPLQITAQPASTPGTGSCKNTRWSVINADRKITTVGPGTPQVINGYNVYVNSAAQILCADDVDGLSVRIQIQPPTGIPSMNVADIFAHHLRLLGTNPAHWSTDPIAP